MTKQIRKVRSDQKKGKHFLDEKSGNDEVSFDPKLPENGRQTNRFRLINTSDDLQRYKAKQILTNREIDDWQKHRFLLLSVRIVFRSVRTLSARTKTRKNLLPTLTVRSRTKMSSFFPPYSLFCFLDQCSNEFSSSRDLSARKDVLRTSRMFDRWTNLIVEFVLQRDKKTFFIDLFVRIWRWKSTFRQRQIDRVERERSTSRWKINAEWWNPSVRPFNQTVSLFSDRIYAEKSVGESEDENELWSMFQRIKPSANAL